MKRYGKIILFDTLALLCFIASGLIGWLPGPAGLPLLLAGLSLLAVNHDWAERWLEKARHGSKTFKKVLFPDVQWIRHTYDAVTTIISISAVYVLLTTDNRVLMGFSVTAVTSSLFIFLVNRQRLDKLADIFKKKKA